MTLILNLAVARALLLTPVKALKIFIFAFQTILSWLLHSSA